jgi:hypothetical protein
MIVEITAPDLITKALNGAGPTTGICANEVYSE